ncbi:MAG: serine hydrolase [Ignavibacteriaceae bacterium]|nr:serine hydrolase [Ignavibacteriaceae bacterium]
MKKLTAVITVLLITVISAQDKKALNDYVNNFVKLYNVPSFAAGIADSKEIIWSYATGFSDLENEVPASTKSVYRIASVSKAITGVAILQLVDAGKIRLDDDVRKYITWFPKKNFTITIRQILNHTSGIRTYKSSEEFNSTKAFSGFYDAIMSFANDTLMARPGTKYIYSSLAYNLLAVVIETASKTSFANYLQKNIFDPAGMKSAILDYQSKIIPKRARGYSRYEDRFLKNAPLADLTIKYPGGGILSNLEDLLRFGIALNNGRLLRPAMLDTAFTPGTLLNGNKIEYGLGFATFKDPEGRKYFGHLGGGTGFKSALLIQPDEKLTVVYLTNIQDDYLYHPLYNLLSIYRGEKHEPLPIPYADTLYRIANTFSADSAISYYERIKNPDASKAFLYTSLINAAKFLLAVKNNKAAIQLSSHAVILNDNSVPALLVQAEAFYNDNNKGLALKIYRKILKLDPDNSRARSMISRIMKETGLK